MRSTHEAEFSKPISPTAIGLMCGLGSCGIIGIIIWAVIHFRSKPINLSTTVEEGRQSNNNINTIGGDSVGRLNAERGIIIHDTSGMTTARQSVDTGVYPSAGIAVNTVLEREILQILDAEASIRAMSRMAARA
jgi:hypothetical protein